MRIAVVSLTSGGLSGGARKYLDEMIPRLRSHPRIESVDVFVPSAGIVTDAIATANAVHVWPPRDGLRGFPSLRKSLREARLDAVFVPTARWVDCGNTPTVVMVRNMEPLERPAEGNTAVETLKNVARAYVARRACQRADRVIAVSQHVAQYLQGRWHIPERRVGVVYHGIQPVSATTPMQAPAGLETQDMGTVLFTAGSIRAARGLEDAIAAIPLLRAKGIKARLVIAGGADASGHRYQREMEQLAGSLGVDESVRWLGHLTQAEMAWCFSHARMFVMTSRSEACPNTALEALSHGSLCVSTDTPPMPEFFVDAAEYYRAQAAASLAHGVEKLWNADPSALSALRERARQRAAAFTWAETLEGTIAQLETARR
jgi:glycosyltransferase involved in cell wall biosynthesis